MPYEANPRNNGRFARTEKISGVILPEANLKKICPAETKNVHSNVRANAHGCV